MTLFTELNTFHNEPRSVGESTVIPICCDLTSTKQWEGEKRGEREKEMGREVGREGKRGRESEREEERGREGESVCVCVCVVCEWLCFPLSFLCEAEVASQSHKQASRGGASPEAQ